MITITRQVDQAILIGTAIRVAPTDIDRTSVRVLAEGRYVGGPQDGEPFRTTHELPKGGSLHFGPLVTLTVIELSDGVARFGVLAPPHLPVAREG